jgi:hypothetical protein
MFKIDDEPGAPAAVPKYQLYVDEAGRHYLSVDGAEEKLIKPPELAFQGKFRVWCIANQYEAPDTEKNVHVFEQMIKEIRSRVKHKETAPFLQTDAYHIEHLGMYFSLRIPLLVRQKGQEFLDGKCGDTVRLKQKFGRIYFKWDPLEVFCVTTLKMREDGLERLKMFIDAKGGYQGEKGAKSWWRWTYWVEMGMFGEDKWRKWRDEKEEEDE